KPAELGVLGTLVYVIKARRLENSRLGAGAAYQLMCDFVKTVEILEPNAEEARLAARLEEAATRLNFQFDIGESQLCAIVVCREADLFCTGDKRAIRGIERLLDCFSELIYLKQR